MSIENSSKKMTSNNLSSYKISFCNNFSNDKKKVTFFRKYSYNKNIYNTKFFTRVFTDFKISVKKEKDITINKHKKSKSTPHMHFDIKNFENLNNEIKVKNKIKNEPYFRKIYSNEVIEFKNEITKKSHYIKKYKEDDISFTKNSIIPEIKWQDYDNDVLTSEEQKKYAIKREMNFLGDTIKRIQNNYKFFQCNVKMYALSQKYPSKIMTN